MKPLEFILENMTLEEKAAMVAGYGLWYTKPMERFEIPSIMLTDGPVGIRKQMTGHDNFGVQESLKTTCYPSGALVACSWDKALIEEMGHALGQEAQKHEIGVLLGPAMNIKRNPLCGRNFEYFSEDPVLTGEMAAAYVKGVQEEGVQTSLKHFAANNQEYRRTTIDAVIDDRTLREIYLKGFEIAVKKSHPATVMASYNRINGTYACEHGELLNNILRNEWGFDGLVVSDWDATNDRILGLKNGLDLRMPCMSNKDEKDIIIAINTGELSEEELNTTVLRNLKMIKYAVDHHKDLQIDINALHETAKRIAVESMILLKNEDQVLPIQKTDNVVIIGEMAIKTRYQGGGSSHLNPTRLENIIDEINKLSGAIPDYAQGYDITENSDEQFLINDAIRIAKNADKVIIFVGLPDSYESEGFDREHMNLPENQNKLIEKIAEVNSNIIVVLANGSPVILPWYNKVKGILETYLGGQAMAGATVQILYGIVNPCGKLAETWPLDIRHTPSYLNYPGYNDKVEYREGVFVGYRYYETKGLPVQFPFGFGLSYTVFSYESISIDRNIMNDENSAIVSVIIKNTGDVAGKEIVQLYVKEIQPYLPRPEKELRNFEKVELQPGEIKTIHFVLQKSDFSFYDEENKCFRVQEGDFNILVGSSSSDILLKKTVHVIPSIQYKNKYTKISNFKDIIENTEAWNIVKEYILRNPFYRMVFEGKFQNADPIKLLGYNTIKTLVDNEVMTIEEFEHMLQKINNLDS